MWSYTLSNLTKGVYIKYERKVLALFDPISPSNGEMEVFIVK